MKVLSLLIVATFIALAYGLPTTPVACYYETYGRGGFSQASCNQGNVRCPLEQNFACLTNTPFIVGIDDESCHFLLFDTTTAVSVFAGGEGESQINGPLNSTELNPTSSPAGQLAIQLLTAELNIRLWRCTDGDCTGADISDLCFRSGPCLGATVKDIVAAAHFKVAGCDDSVPCTGALCDLTLETMSVCLSSFNEAFKGGIYSGEVNVCTGSPTGPSTSPSTGPSTNGPATSPSTGPSTVGPSTGPTTAGPSATGPSTNGPSTDGPSAAGPSTGPSTDSTVPSTTGPSTAGPSAGPSTTGPSTTGPSTTGPSTTGPSTNGPSTGPSTAGPSANGPSATGPSTRVPSTTGPSTNGPSTTGPSTSPSTGPSTSPSTGPSTDSTVPSNSPVSPNDEVSGRRSSANVMAASALLVCVAALL